MIESIIHTAILRAKNIANVEEYAIRLRQYIESDIRHQIKLHGGKNSFDVNTRFSLGFGDNMFYQELKTIVTCTQSGKEIIGRVRIPVPATSQLSTLRGIFHHSSIKAKQANDYYFRNNEISNTELTLKNELSTLFANHKAIVTLNHSRDGSCAVDVELIEQTGKNLSAMFSALESGCLEDPTAL